MLGILQGGLQLLERSLLLVYLRLGSGHRFICPLLSFSELLLGGLLVLELRDKSCYTCSEQCDGRDDESYRICLQCCVEGSHMDGGHLEIAYQCELGCRKKIGDRCG